MSDGTGMLPIGAFTMWLASGKRGQSSNTIVSHLTGVMCVDRFHHPLDPSDFHRCELLLEAVPEARAAFGRMREVSPIWAQLVDEWGDLKALYDAEAHTGMCPALYARMREIRDGAR